MNRFSTLTTNENTSEPSTLNSNDALAESSFLNNSNNDSDNESISEDSRKIRKKRNTYQKIPDDIRMELLESVKNGETLKSAAKRFKVNYSSAKSILHTYRKEGRILKKSAQERTMKKKVLGPSDTNVAVEEVKPEKKKNAKSMEEDTKLPTEVAPFSERHASVSTCASLTDDSSNSHAPGDFNENFLHLLKMDPNDDNKRKTLRKLSLLSQDLGHMHIDGSARTPKQRFEDFFANHSEFQFPENDHHFEEPSSFSYLMDTIKRKGSTVEDFFQDPNNFLYSRCVTPINAENKSFKFDNKEINENGEACPLKSFLDIQCLLKEAFRKNSVSYTGNPGFRKNSFDMF